MSVWVATFRLPRKSIKISIGQFTGNLTLTPSAYLSWLLLHGHGPDQLALEKAKVLGFLS